MLLLTILTLALGALAAPAAQEGHCPPGKTAGRYTYKVHTGEIKTLDLCIYEQCNPLYKPTFDATVDGGKECHFFNTGDCSLNVAHKLKGPGSVKFSETPGSYKCYSR